MNEPDLNNYLQKPDLFALFVHQLEKDFESAACSIDFIKHLPRQWHDLKECIRQEIIKISAHQSHAIPMLLYRIDISEAQIKQYSKLHAQLNYEGLLSELIIKRILQKVVLKKRFSQN